MDSDQPSFTDIEYGNRRRVSRREQFLETMSATIPWARRVGLIEPHYYSNIRGRKAKPIETMLRMCLLQVWFALSDEGVEDAIYDSYAMRVSSPPHVALPRSDDVAGNNATAGRRRRG